MRDVAYVITVLLVWPIVASFGAMVVWAGIPSIWFPLVIGGWAIMTPILLWWRDIQPASLVTRSWSSTDIARAITFVCGVAIVVGSFAPWVTGLGWMDSETVTYHGVWWPDGRRTYLLGLLICGAIAWRTTRYGMAANLLVMVACGVTTIYAVRVWVDPYRFGIYTFHGWRWMEPRWGVSVVAISAVLGLLANTFLLAVKLGRWRIGRAQTLAGSDPSR